MLTTHKPKICADCGTSFQPQRAMQQVCSPICARRKVAADKAKGKRELRARKEAIKTIPDLKREAQQVFNKWVRARDEKQPCISCGKPPGDMSGLHEGRDAGHWRSIGAAPHLRFHEDNCHAQCVRCNQYKAGNAVEYRAGLLELLGEGLVRALEADNTHRKYTRDELIEIKTTYARKLRALKESRE